MSRFNLNHGIVKVLNSLTLLDYYCLNPVNIASELPERLGVIFIDASIHSC